MKISFETANMHTDRAAVRDVWRAADDIGVLPTPHRVSDMEAVAEAAHKVV